MMKDYEKERENYSKKYDEELMKTGIFFAFSNEQFKENQIPQNAPMEDFISCGMGGYIHKSNKSKLDDFFNQTEKELKKDFVSRITIESMIEYELINHECFYTGEPLSIVDLIQSYYSDKTREEIVNLIKSIYHSKNKEKEA